MGVGYFLEVVVGGEERTVFCEGSDILAECECTKSIPPRQRREDQRKPEQPPGYGSRRRATERVGGLERGMGVLFLLLVAPDVAEDCVCVCE